MKIQLPLENWADLLPFVPRRQLLELFFKLIDRQFVYILQYCLNEEGHVTLGHLRIRVPKESYAIYGPILEVTKMIGGATPALLTSLSMPEEPIPKNVHNFKSLTFRYFDSTVLSFLQKFHQHKNALLANVNLSIHHDLPMKKLQPILAQILPLIGDNINSLQLANHHLFGDSWLKKIQYSGNNDEFSKRVTNMLAQTRILSIDFCSPLSFDWYCRWLYAPRKDGRPRMLNIYSANGEALDFINLIKKDFLMAEHPITFFIRMATAIYGTLDFLEEICLENAETNESLLMVKMWCGAFLISRFPREADDAKWIQAYEQEILKFGRVNHDRTIYLEL